MLTGAYYPELSGGGLQCRTLVNALKASVGFTVLATSRRSGLPALASVDGVPVYRVALRGHRGELPVAGWRLLRTFIGLRRNVDIVHFHGFTSKMLVIYALARLFGKRIVEKPTSVGGDDPLTMSRAGLSGSVYARADAFVSVSPGMTARFRASRIPPARVREIPNGVDLRRFRPASSAEEVRALRVRLGLPTTAPIIVSVGFFSRDKAPHILFEAWRRLPPTTGQPYLLFIGSTDPTHIEVDSQVVAAIKGEIGRAGLGERVGFVEATDAVDEYLRASDIYAAPSRREGLSNALLEALASGLPVVAARIDGVTTGTIRDGYTGFLVAPDDPAALANRIEVLVGDPPLRVRFGAAARQLAETGFGIEMVAAKYLELYRDLLVKTT